MPYSRIEGAMAAMATVPVLISLSYNLDKIEKVMKQVGTILAPFGVAATIAALFYLLHSLRNQDKYHRHQIETLSEHHDEQIFNMNIQHSDTNDQHDRQVKQIRQQLLRMEASHREKALSEHIIAVSNNVYYHNESKFDEGIYYINYEQKNMQTGEASEYMCVVYWNISYRSKNRNENYLFDIRFTVFEISNSDAKKIRKPDIDVLVKVLNDKLNEPHPWTYRFSIPRFENGYGQITNNMSSFEPGKLEINEADLSAFYIIIFVMSKVQSFNTNMMKFCADIAKCVDV